MQSRGPAAEWSSVLTRKFAYEVRSPSPSFPRKRESRSLWFSWIPGRASYPSLPGMTIELCKNFRDATLATKFFTPWGKANLLAIL